MVLEQLVIHQNIQKECQELVADVFVQRHPPLKSPPTPDPGLQSHFEVHRNNHARNRSDTYWCVLVVGVNHGHNVGSFFWDGGVSIVLFGPGPLFFRVIHILD